MNLLRRKTTCRVPKHGTWCEVSQEKETRYSRTTEEYLAIKIENECWKEYDPIDGYNSNDIRII